MMVELLLSVFLGVLLIFLIVLSLFLLFKLLLFLGFIYFILDAFLRLIKSARKLERKKEDDEDER